MFYCFLWWFAQIYWCGVSCDAGLWFYYIVLYRHVFVTQLTPRYSEVHSFYTNASQPSRLSTYTTDTLRAALWLQRRWPKAFPAFMTHAAQQLSRSHHAPISKFFSQHKPILLSTCIRHRHNRRMYSVTTQLTQSVS